MADLRPEARPDLSFDSQSGSAFDSAAYSGPTDLRLDPPQPWARLERHPLSACHRRRLRRSWRDMHKQMYSNRDARDCLAVTLPGPAALAAVPQGGSKALV